MCGTELAGGITVKAIRKTNWQNLNANGKLDKYFLSILNIQNLTFLL